MAQFCYLVVTLTYISTALYFFSINTVEILISDIIIISSSIQPLGQFGQEPEPSRATGMALVRCILDKFLRVVCHCFTPRFLDVPTFRR